MEKYRAEIEDRVTGKVRTTKWYPSFEAAHKAAEKIAGKSPNKAISVVNQDGERG